MSTSPKKQPIPFGKYLLLDRINIGGMAEVWRGKMFGAGGFERLVAIKRILPNIAEDEEFITMFIDEAKISVQLTHANIAQIYELGQIQSSYFIAMEYIPGKDMRAIFERCRKKGEPAPIPLTCFVLAKLCEGLDYAHRKKDGMGRDMNIVHRDVSPQNVLISYEGEVKVIDFGIAKAAGKATKTQAGILKGKFGYMSPEQIRGLPLDRRSDVFAIGVCLYEMLTGERLFVGDSDFSVLEKVRKADVLPPSTYNRRIPEALEKIVLKALARDVEERYQYASELADDLQRFLITSEAIFSRKDLMQYMKSTFAEEVEREKIRLQEYAELKAPPELADDGPTNLPQVRPSSPTIPAPSLPPARPASPPASVLPPLPIPSAPSAAPPPGAPRRGASLPNLPKLTAAAPSLIDAIDDNGATIVTDGSPPQSSPGMHALPKLTAAPAIPNAPDDAGATVQTTGLLNESTEPSLPSALPEEDDRTYPARSRAASGTNVPVVDPRLARPTPGHNRVPQSHGRQDTDPAIDALTETPTTPLSPPMLSPGAPASAAPTTPPSVSRSPPMLRPMGEPGQDSPQPLPRAVGPESRPADSRPYLRERVVLPPTHDPVAPKPRPAPLRARGDENGAEDFPGREGLQRNRLPLFIAGGVVVALLLGLIGFFVLPGSSKGYLMINLANPELKGKAHLYINGEDLGMPPSWPAFPRVPLGPALVVVTAEGYEPFSHTVEVRSTRAGQDVPPVEVTLKKPHQSAQLVVVTEPPDAEIRIDGQTVKKQGVGDLYLGEISVGVTRQIDVVHSRYRLHSQEVKAQDASAPLKVSIKLEPLEIPAMVTSSPPGATISANGRQLGTTAANLSLTGDIEKLTLTKKCYDSVEVEVPIPAKPGDSVTIRGELHKQSGCH